MRHRPVADLLVWHRLGVDQVRVGQHGDEDLDIDIAGGGAQRQGLAGKVAHAVEPRLVVEMHLRGRALLQLLREQRAKSAVAVGGAALRQGVVAVLDPELAPGHLRTATLAGLLVLLDKIIPVRRHVPAVTFDLRVKPLPKRPVVEVIRQRPAGQARRRRPFQNIRYRARAHAGRGGNLVARQLQVMAQTQDGLDVDHVDSLHWPRPPHCDRSIDR